jgi:hypothetical protein
MTETIKSYSTKVTKAESGINIKTKCPWRDSNSRF